MVSRIALFITLLVPLAFSPTANAETEDYGPYYDLFVDWDTERADQFYKSVNSASLAWGEAYVLNAFIAGYQLTGDTYWLGRIADHADTVLANMRDVPESVRYDSVTYADGYRGWGTATYTNVYDEFMVHDGRVGAAIAEYIAEVFSNPDELWDEFGERAKANFDTLEAHIIGKWLSKWPAERPTVPMRSYTVFSDLPHNQANAFGTFLVFMNDVVNTPKWAELNDLPSGDPPNTYLPYIQEMAEFLKGDLRIGPEDSYQWGYWPGSSSEDVSHANITIKFMWQCYERGIVFDNTDVRRFANTMSKLMWNGDFENVGINKYNHPGDDYEWTSYIWNWTFLIEADPFLFHIFHNFYRHRTDLPNQYQWEIASAIRLWLYSDLAPGLITPVGVQIEDDGDRVARPGETITLHVTFKNVGIERDSTDGAYVDFGSMFPDNNRFRVIENEVLVLDPDSTAVRSVNVTIPETFSGTEIDVVAASRMMLGGELRDISKSFTLTSGNPTFLEVTSTPSTDLPYDADIGSLLPKKRHTWQHSSADPLSASAMTKFATLLWRTAWALPTPSERDALAAYLDGGGKLILTGGGGNLATWFARSDEDSTFFADYLGITGVWDVADSLVNARVVVRAINSMEFSGIGTMQRSIGAETWDERRLEVMATRRDSAYAVTLLAQDATSAASKVLPGTITGVGVDTTYTALVLGFDVAQVTPPSGGQYMMISIRNWVATATAIQQGALPEPADVNVSSYPNPFNPATTVVFTTPAAGHSRVAIYNVAGQYVQTIADQWGIAGTHEARWDGLTSAGVPAASGVYMVRHEFTEHSGETSSATHRMTLVR